MLPHCIKVLECIKTKGIGPKSFWNIFKAQSNDIDQTQQWLLDHGYDVPCVQHIVQKHEKAKISTLCFCQDDYPQSLKNIPNPPPILFYRGDITLLKKNILGIVGARNASYSGKKIAFNLANALCDRYNITIISGLAKGIDTSAHKGSLEYGSIGVIAQGLDIVYPKENEILYRELLEKRGLILSELEMGIPPNAFSFPVRNRIIAALSQGLIIIEAAFQSGSLTTAKAALEFDKDVFVIPGSPLDPRYKGSHKLIKEGAYLIEDAADIMQHFNILKEIDIVTASSPAPIIYDEHKILEAMSINDPISLEDLCATTHITPQAIMPLIVDFELQGKIKKSRDGRFFKVG